MRRRLRPAPRTSGAGLIALFCVLSLAGCLDHGRLRVGPVDKMIPPQPDTCGLADLPDLRGQEMAELADFDLKGPLRVLWPGQEVTNELQPNRINAEVDVQSNILRLFCG